MVKALENKIIMTDTRSGKKALVAVSGCCAFCAMYLVIFSAVTDSLACLLPVFLGLAVVAVYLSLADLKKYVKYIILGVVGLYTVLCVTIGFDGFVNGALTFVNNVAYTANFNMHYGLASVAGVAQSSAGDYLFCSVLSVWLGLGSAAVVKKSAIAYLAPCLALTLLWLCLGLFPEPYAMVMLAVSMVELLLCDREFTFKAGICYLAIAAVLLAAISPSFIYNGSGIVGGFKSSLVYAAQSALFGTDSLPEGKLKKASGMRSQKDERLRVKLSGDVRNLYLRGFVGSELDGSVWTLTDKNAYVSDGYQGLLDYVAAENIPFAQYSRYSALGGKSNMFDVEVENVGARRKYVYLPYTVGAFDIGSENYDMNVKASVFTPRKYTVRVFAGDKSSEIVQQARWVNNELIQTSEMKDYISVEGQYRGFANATYTHIDGETLEIVRRAIGIYDTGVKEKINPAANLIRNYFRTNFEYSDVADEVGDDFVSEFFGGEIKKANAAYFASAAAVAFRAYGYAARYVEGYLVYAEEGQTEVSVTGNYSHAWTEVYFDGIGWLPIEVTPGFFTTLTEIDPDDPDEPVVDPIKPPDEPVEPPPPVKPIEPEEPLTPNEQNLLLALKILLPVSCVVLAALVVALVLAVHRRAALKSKRKKLSSHGEQFGRNVYGIMQRDFGDDFLSEAEKYGIKQIATERFVELVQRCVYGGHDLSVSERGVVLAYMKSVAEAYAAHGGKIHRFVCKYIKCIGI